MTTAKAYKHLSCLDVGIYVHRILYVDASFIKARVTYFNYHSGIVYGTESVIIDKSELPKWKEIQI